MYGQINQEATISIRRVDTVIHVQQLREPEFGRAEGQ